MTSFADLAGDDDSDVATVPPKKKSFLDLAEVYPPKATKAAPAAADVAGGPFLAQSPQTQANVLADIRKTGAQNATYNGMPLEATTAAAAPAVAPATVLHGAAAIPRESNAPAPAAPAPAPSWWQRAVGAGEAALTTATGAVGGVVGPAIGLARAAVTGDPASSANDALAGQVAQAMTYQPRTAAGQDYVSDIANSGAVQSLPALGAHMPLLEQVAGVGSARSAASVVAPRKAPALRVEPTMDAPATAPSTAAAPTLAQASPELQQAVANAGLTADHPAVARHVEAETLPVPVKLTTGQAAQDPAMISTEMNGRGKGQAAPVPPEFYQAQGQALAKNMDAIRVSAAPDIPATASLVDHGQTLIDAYKAKAAAADANTSSLYKQLSDANGGSLPLNGQDFVSAADAALKAQMKGRYVPPAIAGDLEDFRSGGPMTFENFENLRTNLAAEGRKADRAGDGNAAGAVSIVRNALEQMPMTNETAAVKPLADAARGAAKAQFEAVRADPAYKAAVNDSVGLGEDSPLADRFFQTYVTRGARANVATMAQSLADDPIAKQTIAAGTVDQLKGQLKADPVTGNFSQDSYNKGLNGISPKLDSLLDPKSAQQLQAVGSVAKNAQTQPRGSYVNNSNTATALMAEGAKAAATHGTNMLFGGLPVGSAVRALGSRVMESRASQQAVRQSTDPGAGLMRLSDMTK